MHDAILISGGRGTGKSIFLYNAKTLWDEQSNKEPNKPNIKFLDPIDPTLLQDNDSFSNVIIANIYNCVHEKIQGKPQKESQKFYDCLRKLAESIEDVDKQQLGGLDKLMHYSSGIRVQDNFYNFVKEAIILLGCDALVLPIDDVDMALGKAYDVLEEIRRRLCCPFIIPLVSGDPDLYEHLVKINFGKSIINRDLKEIKSTEETDQKNNNNPEKRLLDNLPNAYLTKVLPHHYRITLQSIDAITTQLKIKWNSNDGIPYVRQNSNDTYQDRLLSYFFGPKHDDEKGRDFPWPKSSRELGQMVRLLRPDDLQSTGKTDKYRSLLENLKTWSSACQHGSCYTLALSALEFKSPCRASQLIAFNLNKQAELNIPWAKYDFIDDQKKLANSYPILNLTSSSSNSNKANQTPNPVATANNLILNTSFRSNVLRSMPPIELHLDKMSVTKAEADNELPSILAIYTYNSYYGTQGNKQLKIYFSRAIELLFTSILNASKNELDNKKIYEEILEQAPFYSIYNLSPTKQVEEEALDNPEIDPVGTGFNNSNKDIIVKINEWNKEHADIIEGAFTNKSQMISLLSAVFNKTLTQIGYLRKSIKNIRDDKLIDLALRFKYITLNSFGFFLKEGGIRVTSNIAIETKAITLKKVTELATSSNTYRENIGWITNSDSIEAKLIDAIAKHPIFVQQEQIDESVKTDLLPSPKKVNTNEKSKSNATNVIQKQAYSIFNKYFKKTNTSNPTALKQYLTTNGLLIDGTTKDNILKLYSDLCNMKENIKTLPNKSIIRELFDLLNLIFEEKK